MRLASGSKLSNAIRGVVFDLDGTLVDSAVDFTRMKERMIKILEGNGVPRGLLTPQETTVVIQEKAERVWEDQGKPVDERARIREEMETVMDLTEMEAAATTVEVQGALDAVKRLRERGYVLAVLTRSHCAYAMEVLRKTGMLDYFDLVLGRKETPRPKPYPEALQHTAKLMGLELNEIVFVGDHHIDASCAENARCHFIGVRTGPRGEESWNQRNPDTLLDSVQDLPGHLSRM